MAEENKEPQLNRLLSIAALFKQKRVHDVVFVVGLVSCFNESFLFLFV